MNHKLKKVLNIAIVLLISINFIKCQQDDNLTPNQTADVLSAQKWFNQNITANDFVLLNYVQDIDWNTAIASNGDEGEVIEVPIFLKDNLTTSNKKDKYDFHRIMIAKSKEGTYKASYLRIITPDASFNNSDTDFNYYSIDNFNGNIYVKELLSESNTQLKFENGKKIIKNLTAKEDAVAEQDCVYFGWWNEDGSFDPISLVGCYGSGGADAPSGGSYGGSSGSGGSSTNPTVTEANPPPSCESFNFTRKKGANWQEALVKNVSFKIVLLTPNGYQIKQLITYSQPILFGMAINFNKGNGDVTPGVAATVSAKVLDESMAEVVTRYARTEASELTVRIYFEERLKENYRMYTNGGTVNFNSASLITATNYKTNLSGTGDCD